MKQQEINRQEISSTPEKKKRRIGKRIWSTMIAGALAVIIGAGAIGTQGFGLLAGSVQAEASSYQVLDLTIGDLSTSVTGTGSLSMSEIASVTVPAGVKVEKVNVQEGQSVKEGDVLVTLGAASVQEQIESINSELATLNNTLASLSGDTADQKISSSVKSRVKAVYGEKGDYVEDVMQEYGALMLLSVDGYMRAELSLNGHQVSKGQSVTVKLSNQSTVSGKVSEVSADGTKIVVLFSDKTADVGEIVTVQDSYNNLLGTAAAQINNVLRVAGSAGKISAVYAAKNSMVYTNTTLYSLTNVPISQEYSEALRQREELLADLAEMQGYQRKLAITSTEDGIVESIGVTKGETLEADAAIDLSTRQRVIVTVDIDELDILNVSPGMTASITFSAMENETFTGTVVFLSAAGTTTNNVTTYPVQIELADDSRYLPGMSATASIVVKQSQDALLVPVSAVSTVRGESYVYVYTGELPADGAGEPGIRTAVTTGLSNDQYAEVTSGLSLGQQVVTAKSTGMQLASASAGSPQQGGGMMGGMMMGGSGGGAPPSGMGGGRPN